MTEDCTDARAGTARRSDIPPERATEPAFLVPLLTMIRTDHASRRSTMPLVIRCVEPAMRAFIKRRVEKIGFDHTFGEDVLQDALLLVSTRAHQCRATTDGAAMRWMLMVAHSALTEALRRDGPRRVSFDDERSSVDPSVTFEESVGRRADLSPGLEILLRLVVDAGSALSPDDATLLWMRLIAEEEWATIGEALGISATAARRRFQRAQRAVRRHVQQAVARLPSGPRTAARDWLRHHLVDDIDAKGVDLNPGD